MSAEITPAVVKAAKVLWGFGSSNFDWEEYIPEATDALAAALDVEEMACAMWVSDHPYYTAEQWCDHASERSKDIYRTLARAARTALLGADS